MRTIFDLSRPGRAAHAQVPAPQALGDLPPDALRESPPALPEVSELQAVRHYTNLSRANYSIDNQFYPLGSCTMKYNPRGAHRAASARGFLERHPLAPDSLSQGFLACLHDLQEILQDVVGMPAVSLTPMAGAQGEFAGVAMIRAYHDARGDRARHEILVPQGAHGTNPATAAMCGYTVREVAVARDGDVDLRALKAAVGPATAGLMTTNPSTCGVFERRISEVADVVHDAGGLLYYDGANLNAILGKVKPGDMGFDVLHVNLHKTFATPHGGGGPGSGPVGAAERLAPYLPGPVVTRTDAGYRWTDPPRSIGRLSAFMGNAGILLRALAYALMLGDEGMRRVGAFATLNANYLAARLRRAGFDLAYPERRASHEFIVTLAAQSRALRGERHGLREAVARPRHARADDVLSRSSCPSASSSSPRRPSPRRRSTRSSKPMAAILAEAASEPEVVKTAPHKLPLRRLDDVKAARELDLRWRRPDSGG